MASERIIKNIENWIEDNNSSIRYKRNNLEGLIKEISEIQTSIDDLERRNKENLEALNILRGIK